MSHSMEKMSSEESTTGSSSPLLKEIEDTESQTYERSRRRACQLSATGWLYLHASFWLLYTILIFGYRDLFLEPQCHDSSFYSPALNAVKYENTLFRGDLEVDNKYKGPPRPELDAAWTELLQPANIRVSGDTLKRLNRTSIKLQGDFASEDAYYATLSVHHHLHCLKQVRHYMHKDYYANITDESKEGNHEEHIDHCLDDIRQTLMCHADISLLTYGWIPDYRKPWPNFEVQHECVNWDRLQHWALEHSFSAFDQKSLVHPQLGLSFPLVDGKVETVANGDNVHLVQPSEAMANEST